MTANSTLWASTLAYVEGPGMEKPSAKRRFCIHLAYYWKKKLASTLHKPPIITAPIPLQIFPPPFSQIFWLLFFCILIWNFHHNCCWSISVSTFLDAARFSPDDKYSRQRVLLKKRFGLLPTQQPAQKYWTLAEFFWYTF